MMAMRWGDESIAQRSCKRRDQGHLAAQTRRQFNGVDGTRRLHDHRGLSGQVLEPSLREYVTVIQNHDAVARAFGFGEVVRRDQDGASTLALGGDQLTDDLATFCVNGRGGLVQDQGAGSS